MSDAMVGGAWVEEKITQRHQSVRLRMMRELHGKHKAQREKRRDIARLLLAATVVFLGVVVVEMGRKAIYLSAVATAEHGRFSG